VVLVFSDVAPERGRFTSLPSPNPCARLSECNFFTRWDFLRVIGGAALSYRDTLLAVFPFPPGLLSDHIDSLKVGRPLAVFYAVSSLQTSHSLLFISIRDFRVSSNKNRRLCVFSLLYLLFSFISGIETTPSPGNSTEGFPCMNSA